MTVYAEDFGEYRSKQVLEIRTQFEGCIVLATCISFQVKTEQEKAGILQQEQESIADG